MQEKNINVLLADDHLLIRDGLTYMLKSFERYEVCGYAGSGIEVINLLKQGLKPEVILMDIEMPLMNGIETTRWVKSNYPKIKIIALTMHEDRAHVVAMLRSGADGYLAKDSSPDELKRSLDFALLGDFYYNDAVTTIMHKCVVNEQEEINYNRLSERHIEFLKLASTEMTYKEVAAKMSVSVRTIDGYRDELFEKLNIKSRVGLVLYAIENGLVQVPRSSSC
jgi:DNA-binding NarL/FixJ family response regulator